MKPAWVRCVETVTRTWVVKRHYSYVHDYVASATSIAMTARWTDKQSRALRFVDRKGAAVVADNVRGRIVRLRKRGAK